MVKSKNSIRELGCQEGKRGRAVRNGSSSEVNGAGDMSDGASITDGILNGSGVAETHKTLDPQLVTETGPSNTE